MPQTWPGYSGGHLKVVGIVALLNVGDTTKIENSWNKQWFSSSWDLTYNFCLLLPKIKIGKEASGQFHQFFQLPWMRGCFGFILLIRELQNKQKCENLILSTVWTQTSLWTNYIWMLQSSFLPTWVQYKLFIQVTNTSYISMRWEIYLCRLLIAQGRLAKYGYPWINFTQALIQTYCG